MVEKLWEALGRLLEQQPEVAFLMVSLAFEAPSATLFARAGSFQELLIVGGLGLGNAAVYYILRKVNI